MAGIRRASRAAAMSLAPAASSGSAKPSACDGWSPIDNYFPLGTGPLHAGPVCSQSPIGWPPTDLTTRTACRALHPTRAWLRAKAYAGAAGLFLDVHRPHGIVKTLCSNQIR